MEQGCARCNVGTGHPGSRTAKRKCWFRSGKAVYFGGCEEVSCAGKIDKVSTYELNGVCPLDCQNNGKFKDGKCVCVGKFSGERCENIDQVIEEHKVDKEQCPRNCSNQGSAWKVCVCATKVSTGPTARSRSHAQTARRNAPVNQNALGMVHAEKVAAFARQDTRSRL